MASTEDVLDGSLQSPLDHDTKREIIKHFWELTVPKEQSCAREINCDPFFQYYTDHCLDALHDRGRHTCARSHRDIIEIVQHLKDGLTRGEIRPLLKSKLSKPMSNEDELLNSAIDLAASLLLMIEIGCLQYGFSGQKQLVWTQNSLESCVRDHFNHAPILGNESVKLEKMFNAWNLGRIGGIEIIWTTNLTDHLRMMGEDKKVAIFQHATFLENQRSSSIFPDKFIDETLRTLTLLFPQDDRETRKWFRGLASTYNLDRRVIARGQLRADDRQIENFYFWRDRLVILKQVFDEARPRTLSQWWYDRRNGVQWYTFWVAVLVLILTIFFGLIQCIEGALQVYKAFVPTR